MSTTALPVIDKTIQETNLWLKTLMNELGTEDRHDAYGALKAVLHALRDRIGPENAVHLGAQLPILVRGIYYEGWHPATTPTHERHVGPFLEHLADRLPLRLAEHPEKTARAVFNLLWQKIDQGEVAKIIEILPVGLRELWESVPA